MCYNFPIEPKPEIEKTPEIVFEDFNKWIQHASQHVRDTGATVEIISTPRYRMGWILRSTDGVDFFISWSDYHKTKDETLSKVLHPDGWKNDNYGYKKFASIINKQLLPFI